MACGEAKCSWPGPALLSSMMTRPAVRAEVPKTWKSKWATVPERFCSGVCVGWRTSAAWMESRKPAELRSCTIGSVLVRWMETRGRLYGMCGEEDDLLREDGAPNDGCELPHVSISWWTAQVRPPGRTYNPYASLCNSCSACIMSVARRQQKAGGGYLSRGFGTRAVPRAGSRRLYALEAAPLHFAHALLPR
jgi:hypothetical protein